MEQSEFMRKLELPCDDSSEVNQQLIIDTVKDLRDKIREMRSEINRLTGEIHGLKDEASVMGLHEHILQERLDAVIEIVGDETLVNRMIDDIETEDIIDAWIRAKTVGSFSKEGRQ